MGKGSKQQAAPVLPDQPIGPSYIVPDFKFDMPDFSADFAASQAASQAAADKAAAKAEKAAQRRERDDLYSGYLDAASSATDHINSLISQEQSNADLLGIDYKIDEASKSTRISNYFATIWNDGDQQRLEGLFKKAGKPKGFDGFAITAGDASAADGKPNKTADKTVSTSGTKKRTGSIVGDEEETLATSSLLGQ